MKFILDKDKLTIEEKDKPNSGSVNYYEIEVEHDESWDDLTIKAVLVANNEDTGRSISLIDNKVYIDNELDGTFNIGFVGYTIQNNTKVYQISSNLKSVNFNKGAGQITTQEGTLPTPTQWEIYVAQLQEIVDDITGLSNTLTAQVEAVEERLANGDFDGADGITPTIGQNGNWFLGDTDTGKPSRGENGTNGINGTNGTNGTDGFSPIATVTQISNGATISITDKNGTTTASVYNGTNGQNGTNGTNGQDGYSPVATVTQTSGGATISITDKNGTTTANITNGTTPDISGKFDKSDVTSSYSTTSGKVYDVTYINTTVGNIETLLGGI